MLTVRLAHSRIGSVSLLLNDAEETVGSLKHRFASAKKEEPVYFQLFYKDMELSDESPLQAYNVCDNEEISVRDSPFTLRIQGPYPLCEITTMTVTRTTTIASIKEAVMKMYNYTTEKEFDIICNQSSLISTTQLEKHRINDEDVLIVAERIVTHLEPLRKKSSTSGRPVYSPVLEKKSSQSNFDRMMDSLMSLFTADKDPSQLKSQSMPDLLLSDDDDDGNNDIGKLPVIGAKKKAAAFASRKISVPVKF